MSNEKPFRVKFFLPDARLLDKNEIEDMMRADRIPPTAAAGKDGLWLEMKCPDQSCLDDEGRITLPNQEQGSPNKGIFLKLFCPEGNCEIVQSTDVP